MVVFINNKPLLIGGGIAALIIGAAALIWPSITARIFAFLVGALFLAEAIVGFFSRTRTPFYQWSAIGQGIVGLVVALLLVLFPGVALRVVVILAAIWLLIRGGVYLFVSYQNRDLPALPLFSSATGAISLVVGLLLAFRPEAGIIAFAWLFGVYAILIGVFALLWARQIP